MKNKISLVAALIALLFTSMPLKAIDLLERYPTQLTAGDAEPEHARQWEFTAGDIFHVSKFEFVVGDKLKVVLGSSDLGIGHSADGAVWAVLLPREPAVLSSPVSKKEEAVVNVWLRFHPAQIARLFPSDTVLEPGNTELVNDIRSVANAKMSASWQAGMKAMIPEPKDMTVYVDTRDGSRRFFIVDTEAQKADYVAAFDPRSARNSDENSISSLDSAPPVVIRTFPEAGSTAVAPGLAEISVTFSKEMMDQSWSWCGVWDNSNAEGVEAPKYDPEHRTCAVKVKLEPNKTYGYWLNTQKFRNFRDKQGHAAVPYLLIFQTKSD